MIEAFLLLVQSAAPAADPSAEARMVFEAWRRLDPSPSSTSTEPLPPCTDGSSTCNPWERDWSKSKAPAQSWAIAAPFGTHTYGGRAWTYLNPPTDEDVFSIATADVTNGDAKYVVAWIRGSHLRNKRVAYRSTMSRFMFHCRDRTQRTVHYSEYAADGTQLRASDGRGVEVAVVPGTNAEHWMEVACRIK